MLKVLLVDDEALALEGLKGNIKWDNLGYEVCGVCSDGEEALKSIKQLRPDLVITDIKMPVMNGLELISQASKLEDNVRFIVMSGYSEFEYAKKALQYGVKHYMLKPVFEEEFIEVLKTVSNEIIDSKAENVENKEEIQITFGSIIKKLIHKECCKNEFYSIYNKYYSEFQAKEWCYILIKSLSDNQNCKSDKHKVQKLYDFKPSSDRSKVHLQENKKQKISILLKDLVSEEPLFITQHSKNYYGILVGFSYNDKTNANINNFVDRLYSYLRDNCEDRFFIGVGTSVVDLNNLSTSYNGAAEALNYSFYMSSSGVLYYNRVKNRTLKYGFEQNEFINRVIEGIEEVDLYKVEKSIDSLFSYFSENMLAPEIIYMYVKNIIFKSHNIIKDTNKQNSHLKGINIFEFEHENTCMSKLKDLLINYCSECCRSLAQSSEMENDNSYRVLEYIRENYKRAITIKEISKSLYINPVYLGQLFKNKFGLRFNQYIHMIRIEEAKRLLRETSMKTCEIAEELGYCNYNVFLQYFEKNTGTKPTDYKKNIV